MHFPHHFEILNTLEKAEVYVYHGEGLLCLNFFWRRK